MNKLAYDLTNLIVLILISTGVYLYLGLDIAFIVAGSLGLVLNLITLYIATQGR